MTEMPGFTLPPGWTTVNVGQCRGCGVRVLWCRTQTGRGVAIDRDGGEHRLRCTDADRMTRGRFSLLSVRSEVREG